MIPLVTLSTALGISAVLFMLWPLFEFKERKRIENSILATLEKLLFEKERYLLTLKDLELDHSMNKMSESDYQSLRAHFLAEASDVYAQIDEIEKSRWIQKIIADAMQVGEQL